jgi:hypothetical protein
MHGLLALFQIGFGNALGALMSGIFYDQLSTSTLFLIATGCGAASMVSLFVSIM